MEGTKDTLAFKIGDFECLSLTDLVGPLNIESFFPQIPAAQIEGMLKQYNITGQKTFEVKCLLVRTDKHLVLIDTGWGASNRPDAGRIMQGLKSKKIDFREIDTVILSHCHPDHIGGNTNVHGQPSFPGARYYFYRPEWEYWVSEIKRTDAGQVDAIRKLMLELAQKNLLSIQKQVELIDSAEEIIPGIRFQEASGHTPGHCTIEISSGSGKLVYFADTAHHRLQIAKPDLGTPFDSDIAKASQSRLRIIQQSEKYKTLIFSCHFPFPGLGYFERNGADFTWRTVDK
jgi:glyoxylase-like metal-dependent hydrolase (beta-lactamase superfamily II)